MKDIILSPPNERELDELYAFLSVDDNGLRGIVAGPIPGIFGMTTFVTGSPKVLDYMRSVVPAIAKATGKRIVLYKFTRNDAELASWAP
jgi:hypothetical protein